MWQRIQTLYLAVATILVASLLGCDVADLVAENGELEPVAYTSKPVYLGWIILLTVFQVLSLGGFKWRTKQMRVTVITALLCLGFQGWLVYDFILYRKEMIFSFTALFPFAAAVLDVLAARSILMDEALVQSVNRLRSARKKKK